MMNNSKYFIASDFASDYAWVIDRVQYNTLSWWQRFTNPTQSSIYAGTRYECQLICNELNQRKE